MVTRPISQRGRSAAVSASTVFAIALAIVAGLIFAWLFKIVLLEPKKVVKPQDDTVEIAVAAANIYDQTEIKSIHVKKAKVDRKRADSLAKASERGAMLQGNQPVGRVTKRPIKAEEPFYEDDLLPYTYPEPVKVRSGWRSAIISVPAKDAMVQVGEYVDVYVTLANEALGAGATGTAEIAKGAKVIARFGTTRPGAQPANLSAPREYTLEVTPYRAAMIELAKSMGARFGLTNAPMTTDGDKPTPPPSNDVNDPREQVADRVNGADLQALFGISPQSEGPPPWQVERYVGIKKEGQQAYPGYVPPSRGGNGTTTPATNPATSGNEGRTRPQSPAVPVSYAPPTRSGSTLPPPPITSMPPPPVAQRTAPYSPSTTVASSNRNFGFRAPTDPNANKGCVG